MYWVLVPVWPRRVGHKFVVFPCGLVEAVMGRRDLEQSHVCSRLSGLAMVSIWGPCLSGAPAQLAAETPDAFSRNPLPRHLSGATAQLAAVGAWRFFTHALSLRGLSSPRASAWRCPSPAGSPPLRRLPGAASHNPPLFPADIRLAPLPHSASLSSPRRLSWLPWLRS